jgi:hypothetical protein
LSSSAIAIVESYVYRYVPQDGFSVFRFLRS